MNVARKKKKHFPSNCLRFIHRMSKHFQIVFKLEQCEIVATDATVDE